MKHTLPFFLLLSSALWAQPCSLKLQGRVMDPTHTPLPGATLYIQELKIGISASEDGAFVFTHLCEGTYTLTVSFLGYKPYAQKVKLKRSESLHIDLEVDETLLNEVVVQDHYDHISASQTTAALSGAALEATRGKTLGAALKSIAGVNTIQAGPAIFKPVIHGVHSQRILILNNGIRHEGQQWGAEHAPEIDPFLASNIVVVKDASAIKYGADALGGVVIVNPGALPTEPGVGGSVFTGWHSNGRGGTVAGLLEGASQRVKGLSWRTHGSIKKSGDYHAPDYSLTNTGFNEANLSAAAQYHHSEASGVEVFYSRFTSEVGLLKGSSVNSTDDLLTAYTATVPTYTQGFSYAIGSPRQEVTHDLVKAMGHIHKGNQTFSAQYALQINRRKEFQLRRGDLVNTPTLNLRMFTHTLDLEWEEEKPNHQLRCVGINAMVQQNRNVFGTQTIPFVPNFSNYSAGLFAIQKFNVGAWQAEAGTRFDYRYYTVAGRDYSNAVFTSSFVFANVSATIGATRHLGLHSRVTTGLSTAWRPPHVAELYSIGTHQSAVAVESGLLIDSLSRVQSPNDANIKNEKAWKWVSTWFYTTENTQLEVSGYVNYIFNYLFLKPEGVTRSYPYFQYRQTDALLSGVDIRAEQKLLHALTARVTASLLYAKDITNNDYFIYVPPNRAEVVLRYEKKFSARAAHFFAEAGASFVARQTRAPRIIALSQLLEAGQQGIDLFENDTRAFDFVEAPPAYWLAQASVGTSFHVKEQKMDVRLSGDNLFNRSYREYTNRMRYFSDEMGRNVAISITYNF